MSYVETAEKILKKYGAGNGSASGSSSSSGGQKKPRWEELGDSLLEKYSPANNQDRIDKVSNWVDRYTKTMKGWSDYDSKRNGAYTTDVGGGYGKDIDSLIADYEEIQDYASRFGLPDAGQLIGNLRNLNSYIKDQNSIIGSFESEDAYNTARRQAGWNEKYRGQDWQQLQESAKGIEDKEEREYVQNLSAWSRQEYLRGFDTAKAEEETAKAEEEIAEIQRQIDRIYEGTDFTLSSSRTEAKSAADALDNKITALRKEINDARKEINEARNAQKADSLSGVGNQESKYYDRNFDSMSGYSGRKGLSQYINETEQERSQRQDQEDIWGQSGYTEKNYDRLNEDEKKVFNYWDNYDQKNGTNKAQEFLDSIQETLNYRKGQEINDSREGKSYLYDLALATAAGIDQWQTGASRFGAFLTGNEEYTPATANQIALGMAVQDAAENGHKIPLGEGEDGQKTWEQFGLESAASVGNMLPSMVTSFALGAILPGVGLAAGTAANLTKAGSLAVMGAGIAGNTYTEAINQGYSADKAKAYAFTQAASEIVTEYALGGIEKMTGIGTDAMQKTLLKKLDRKNIDSAILRFCVKVGTDALGESFEEGIQGVIEPWLTNITLDQDNKVYTGDVLYQMLCGFATSMVMSGPQIGIEEYGTYRTGRQAVDSGVSIDTMKGIGETFRSGDVYELSKKINDKTGAYTIGRYMNAIGASLSEQNVSDITNYILNKGLPLEVARHNAQVLNYIALGGELSSQDMKTVNADEILADAFREMVLNKDSDVSKRTEGYQSILKGMNGETKANATEVWKAEERANAELGERVVSDPNRAALAVESLDGDTMQVRMKDGSVSDSTIAQYGTGEEALLFETARKFGGDTAGANRIVNGFDEETGLSMQEYCKGVEDSYRYGKFGFDESELKRGMYASQIDAASARSAYQAGIRDARLETARKQAQAMENRKSGQEAALHFDRKGRKFNAKQETAISTMDQLSKAFGVDFWVFESYEKNGQRMYVKADGTEAPAPNGWYDENGIHIDLNAGKDGRGVMLYTLGHELTHHIRKNSPEKFKAFADLVMENYGKIGVSADKLVQEQIAKAKRNGRDIGYEEAYEEVIADSMEGILADGKVLQLVNKLQETDASIGNKVRKWFADAAEKIRSIVEAYKNERPDSAEGQMVANMKEILPQLEELYAEGLVDAGKKDGLTPGEDGTASGETETKNAAADDGGVKYQARQVGYDYSKPFSEQIDDWKAGLIPKKDTLIVGETPEVFKGIGMASLPVTINKTHIDYALNGTKDFDHYFGESLLKQLPTAIKSPVAIMTSGTKNNSSVVVMLEIRHNGKQIIAPVSVGGFGYQNGIRIDSNAITSAYGKDSSISKVLKNAIDQENQGVFRLYYLDTKKATALLQGAKVLMPKMPATHNGGYIHSLSEKSSPVKVKLKNVTESQQFKRWFGDWENHPNSASKVVNADGTPKIVYHQTSSDFTIFDPRHEGAGTRDSDTPFGIFMKSSDKDIGLKGGKQMALYASIKNPFVVHNREELIAKLTDISPDYSKAAEELRNLNVDYSRKFEEAKEAWRNYMTEWRKEHPDSSRTALYDDEQFNRLFSAEDDVIDEWEAEARKIETRSKEAITKDLEANGYDGIFIQQDKGSFGRTTDAYIALHPEQVKSATDNIGTFDGQNPDIRYSDRDQNVQDANRILQKQNDELKDLVSELREIVRLQGRTTNGTVYTRGSIEASGRKLMRMAGAKGDVTELSGILSECYSSMAEGSEDMVSNAQKAAQWLVEHKSAAGEDAGLDAASVNEQMMNVYESFTGLIPIRTVADKYQGKIDALKSKYNRQIQDIRSKYSQELAELKKKRAEDIRAVRHQMQEQSDARQQAVMEDFARQKEDLQSAREDTRIMEREFIRLAREYEKTSKAGSKADAERMEFKDALKAEASRHKQDNAMWEQEFRRLSREYEKAGKSIDKLQAQLEKTRASASARVESRKQTAARNQIKDIHAKLQKMILSPAKADTMHAPVGLTRAVADVCDLFVSNLEQAGQRRSAEYDARIDQAQAKLDEKPGLKGAAAQVDTAKRQNERISNTAQKLKAMRDQYKAIKNDGSMGIYYDENVAEMIKNLSEDLSGKDIYQMTSDELEQVKNTMTAIYHTVVNANRVFSMGKDKTLIGTAKQLGKEISDVNVEYIQKYLPGAGRYLNWQMNPDTFFDALCGFAKDNTGRAVQRMFQRGNERMLSVQRDYYNITRHITENKAYQKELSQLLGRPTKNMVDWGLKDSYGDAVKTSRGFMLQAYMLLTQEDSLNSLVYGGFKIPRQEVYYKDRSKAFGDMDEGRMLSMSPAKELSKLDNQIKQTQEAIKSGELKGAELEQAEAELSRLNAELDSVVMGEKYRLLETRDRIEKMLTPFERDCIETARQWYAYSGKLMADVFEQMYGYRPKLVDNYVEIHRDLTNVKTDIRETDGTFNLENSGFTKERVKSTAPILLTDFFVELESQKNRMSRYYGFTQAQKDFGRIWKVKMPGERSTIESKVAAKFGTGNTGLGVSGVQYVKNYINSMAGSTEKNSGVFDKFYSAAASKTLSLNPRVAVSQLASIPTAAAVVGWKNMAVGLPKGLATAVNRQKKNALAQKNVYFFQRYRGEGGIVEMADLRTGGGIWNRIASSKAGKLLFNWCQSMDVFATATMYSMAEEAAKSRGLTPGSQEFDAAANEIYTEIIRKTQPNYTVTERSDMLRDQRAGMKLINMYKTQPNQNFNLLLQSAGRLAKAKRDVKTGANGVTAADVTAAAKDFANSATAVIIGGNITFVLLRTAVNLLMADVKGYRDDETGEISEEKLRDSMFREFLSSMSGMFALGGQLYDIIYSVVCKENYYGLTDSAISVVSGVLEQGGKLFQKILSDDPEDQVTAEDWLKFTGKALGAMGVPYDNAKKFLEAARQWKYDLDNGSLGKYANRQTTDRQFRNRFVEAYRNGDEDTCNDILAILAANLEAPNDRRAQKDVRSGFRSHLKEQYLKGKVTEEEVRGIMTEYLDADSGEVDAMLNSWKGITETGKTLEKYQEAYLYEEVSSEDYIRYLTTYSGKTREEAEKAELRLRCERDTGYAYDEIREKYIDQEISGIDAAAWMETYGGLEAEEAETKLKEYDFEREYGYSWDDRADAYLNGDITRQELKYALMDISGKRAGEADSYLEDLDFEQEYGFRYSERVQKYLDGTLSRDQLRRILIDHDGMFQAKAEQELTYYDWYKAHPNTKLKFSEVSQYVRTVENAGTSLYEAGISEDLFIRYKTEKNKCKGVDENDDGIADSGSKQAQILPIIDALPITEAQKDVLWFHNGWSKKTLNRKAPWKK